jgi:hypothetical protein
MEADQLFVKIIGPAMLGSVFNVAMANTGSVIGRSHVQWRHARQ